MSLHPNVAAAIAGVRQTFGDERVMVVESGDGSAVLTIAEVDIGPKWTPSIVELTVVLAVTFPTTAVYPYYVSAGLTKADGSVVSNMTANVTVAGRTYNQVSLTSSPLRPGETLGERLLSAISWFRSS